MRQIFWEIFPTILSSKSNKKLKKQNTNENSGILQYTSNAKKITIDSLKQKYKDTYDAKNKLEDKAKTNIFGITVAITLIMGSIGTLSTIESKYPFEFVKWFSFFVFFVAVIYLLVAGIMAVKVLCDENVMSDISLGSLSKNDEKSKYEYDKCIAKNINQNLIRNNMIYASYACIRNAIICIIIIFVLATVPINFTLRNEKNTIDNYNQSFYYSQNALEILESQEMSTTINDIISDDLNRHPELKEGQHRSFINQDHELFIKYKLDDNTVKIELIESISLE